MAKKSNLESGFLFLYDWAPAIEQLPAKEVKKLILALMARQRDNTPLPLFDNALTASYARMIEPCIKRRLDGQAGGNKAHDTPLPPTLPTTEAPSPHSKEEKSKEKKSKASFFRRPAGADARRATQKNNSSFDAEEFFEAAVAATYGKA